MDQNRRYNYVENLIARGGDNGQNLGMLVEDAIDWAHCFGLVLRTPEHKDRSDVCQNAPFALLPSPFPRKLFDQAMAVQKAMNVLYFRISWDYDFLIKAHEQVIKGDSFTAKMVEILARVHEEGVHQSITLLTQRADYMCHDDPPREMELKQIEVNNIAVSMGGLAQRATLLHRRLLTKLSAGDAAQIRAAVPDNSPVKTLAQGIHQAWTLFGDSKAIILVVVDPVNQNQCDQRFIEYELEELSNGTIDILRLTFTQCYDRLALGESDFSLWVDGQRRVGVVYFRSGYVPDNYPTDKEWEARLRMERSTAIKCPWIGLQLANTKKIQQVLTGEGVVERYFPGEPDVAAQVRRTFAQMWGLENDDEKRKEIIEDAIAHPENYVLKPQLEGGGGNFFGAEISQRLRAFTPEQMAAHILMQKIKPLVIQNYMIRSFGGVPELTEAVSELGVYGSLIGRGGFNQQLLSVDSNQSHGHILRTKAEHVNEGGVAVGAAVIDTPYLI